MLFEIIKNLYTNRKSDWIKEVSSEDIQPVIIQKWLCMNDQIRVQVRWLDKYVFALPPKMYLSLAWSILPKADKAPFVTYIKEKEEEEEFDFILALVKRQFKMSDNDFNAMRTRLIAAIKLNMTEWFCYYGIPKQYWKKYNLDFNDIKQYGVSAGSSQKSLFAF